MDLKKLLADMEIARSMLQAQEGIYHDGVLRTEGKIALLRDLINYDARQATLDDQPDNIRVFPEKKDA